MQYQPYLLVSMTCPAETPLDLQLLSGSDVSKLSIQILATCCDHDPKSHLSLHPREHLPGVVLKKETVNWNPGWRLAPLGSLCNHASQHQAVIDISRCCSPQASRQLLQAYFLQQQEHAAPHHAHWPWPGLKAR